MQWFLGRSGDMAFVTLAAIATLLLSACGGGGGGGDGSSTPTPTPWSVNNLGPWRTLAAQCQTPRTGTDPYTNQPYPDKQGTTLDEQNFLASWTDDTYLWYSEVDYQNPSGFATPIDYFNVLKTNVITASGAPKDKFHFTYSTAVWEALSLAGQQAGYGATFDVIAAAPPRDVVVAYDDPGTPATSLSPPLARGAEILTVDGYDVVNDNTQAGVNAINAGLFPAGTGESHMFEVLDAGSSTPRTITMVSANITSTPVQNVTTVGNGTNNTVGYMLYNEQIATAESELIAAINTLNSASPHINDLVLDLRYNGGGYLDLAAELAYMIAGPTSTSGQTFDLTQFNAKYPTTDPVALTTIVPTPFWSTTQGFSTTAGQALPTLNLSRVFVLTGSTTCSASEAIMNGLRGVGVQVIQVGSTTCGKPYGFYPQDNCGTTYFAIQFQGVNAAGFGDYPDGFVPQNGATTGIDTNAILPGCSVGDDLTHALGDPAETRFSVALAYQAGNQACPAPTGIAAYGKRNLKATEGHIAKPEALMNRIQRRPHLSNL
jgi:hypothetical protein